jgi:hypothetical protein
MTEDAPQARGFARQRNPIAARVKPAQDWATLSLSWRRNPTVALVRSETPMEKLDIDRSLVNKAWAR